MLGKNIPYDTYLVAGFEHLHADIHVIKMESLVCLFIKGNPFKQAFSCEEAKTINRNDFNNVLIPEPLFMEMLFYTTVIVVKVLLRDESAGALSRSDEAEALQLRYAPHGAWPRDAETAHDLGETRERPFLGIRARANLLSAAPPLSRCSWQPPLLSRCFACSASSDACFTATEGVSRIPLPRHGARRRA